MSSVLKNFEVYSVLESDLDEIIFIENLSFPDPWPRKIFEMELKSDKSYNLSCKDEAGKILGYCLSWLIYDEVHILKVAVHPDYRNLGIGKHLIYDTLDHFNGRASHAVLEVRTENDNAINLYEKIGFKPLRIRKNYYRQTGEDALVMLLDMD